MSKRRTKPQLSKTELSPNIQKLLGVLATPEGLWRSSRTLAAKALWTSAPGLHALQPLFDSANPLIGQHVSTMGVDKWFRCYVNEDFVEYMRDLALAVSVKNPCPTCGAVKHEARAYIAGVICHEAGHPIRKHSQRAESFGVPMKRSAQYQWNVGGDLALNDDLLETFELLLKEVKGVSTRLCLPHFAALEHADPFEAFKDPTKSFSWVTMKTMHFATAGIKTQDGVELRNRVTLQGDTPFSFTATYNGHTIECEGDITGTYGPGQTLRVAGCDLVFKARECLQPKQFRGPGFAELASFPDDQTVEYYYNELHKLNEAKEDKSEPEEGDDKGEGDEPGPFLAKQGEPTDCGSGAHGGQSPHELGAPTEANPGVSEAETEVIRQEIADKIRDAAARHGTMSKGMQMWAEGVLKPSTVRWQTHLKRVLRNAVVFQQGHDVRTFRRLGRASATSGLAYPSTHSPKPRIGVVLDTSGSMGHGKDSLLHEAYSEVEGICKQLGAEVVFLAVDAQAGEIQEITSFREACIQGGGGTDMRVGITAMEKLKKPISTCVVLTDGDTPWPAVRPRKLKVVAGIVGGLSTYSKVPDFIKVVEIGKDQ